MLLMMSISRWNRISSFISRRWNSLHRVLNGYENSSYRRSLCDFFYLGNERACMNLRCGGGMDKVWIPWS